MIVASVVVGLGLMIGAAPLGDGWWASVLIEVGASVLLLAPLTYIEGFLRRSLDDLNVSLRSSAAGVSAFRNLLPPGPRRTKLFDELLGAVGARAAAGEFPADQIGILLRGDGDDRTVALAAMAGAPSLVDGPGILRSIRCSENGNEQFYALRAAKAGWATWLADGQRARILEAIDEDYRTRRWIVNDPHRQNLAQALRKAPAPPSSGPS